MIREIVPTFLPLRPYRIPRVNFRQVSMSRMRFSERCPILAWINELSTVTRLTLHAASVDEIESSSSSSGVSASRNLGLLAVAEMRDRHKATAI